MALGELEPQEEDHLSLEGDRWGSEWGECTKRVSTSRSGDEVVAHYRSQLEARGWRVDVRPERYFSSQCTSGRGRCQGLLAVLGTCASR